MSESQEISDQFADEVVSLAAWYRNQQELSIYEMLKRTGYFTRRQSVTVDTIRKALARSPEQIGVWLEYSEDKRTDSGWYIKRDSGRFEVGRVCTGGSIAEQKSYSDPVEACGDFILHELDQIAFE